MYILHSLLLQKKRFYIPYMSLIHCTICGQLYLSQPSGSFRGKGSSHSADIRLYRSKVKRKKISKSEMRWVCVFLVKNLFSLFFLSALLLPLSFHLSPSLFSHVRQFLEVEGFFSSKGRKRERERERGSIIRLRIREYYSVGRKRERESYSVGRERERAKRELKVSSVLLEKG